MCKTHVPQVGAVWYDNNKRGRALFRRAGKHTALLQMDTPGHFPGNGGFFMRGAVKKLAASLALACLLACAALGAQSVPGAVLDARQSTVRVLAVSGGNVSSGTGFAVARNSRYVVTNYHVVEGYEEFEGVPFARGRRAGHSEGRRAGCGFGRAGNGGAPEGAGPCAAHKRL